MHKAWFLVMMGGAVAAAGALGACGDSGGSGGSGGDADTTTSKASSSSQSSTSTSMSASTATTVSSTSSGPIVCSEPSTSITGECDLLQQDCPNGESCVVFQDPDDPLNSIAQCDSPGIVGLGQPCMPGECQAGLLCVGTCTYVCCPFDAEMGANEPCGIGQCNLNVTFMGTDPPDNVYVCTYDEVCTLFQPDSCPAGKDCHLAGTGLANCSVPSPGNYMDGDVCEGNGNDCPDSAICIDPDPMDMDTTQICRYLCEAGSSNAPGLGGCPGGQVCDESIYDFGFPNVGMCRPAT